MRVPVAWGWLTLLVLFATSAAGQFLTDATTGCMVIEATAGLPGIGYTSPIFVQLATNVSTGATSDAFTVPNCVVCLNGGTIITGVPAPTIEVPLEMIPSFLGTNCIVSTPATSAGSDNVCASSTCGDGYRSADEVCDDGRTDAGGSCNIDCSALNPEASVPPIHLFETIVKDDGYINTIVDIIDEDPSLHSSSCGVDCTSGACFEDNQEVCPLYDVNQASRVKLQSALATFVVESMGAAGGLSASTNTVAAVTRFTREQSMGEFWSVKLLSASNPPSGATYLNSYGKTIVPTAAKTEVYIQCHPTDFALSPSTYTVAQLRGINDVIPDTTAGAPDCVTDFNWANGGTQPICKYTGDILAEIQLVGICSEFKTQTKEMKMYIISETSGNLYVDLTLKLVDSSNFNSHKYLAMYNFMAVVVPSMIEAPTLTVVGDVDLVESATATTLSLTFSIVTQIQTGFYDFSDAGWLSKITISVANAAGLGTDWSQVKLLDILKAGDDQVLSQVEELQGNRMYMQYVVDGSFTGKLNFEIPAYWSSVLVSGRTKITATFDTYVCQMYKPTDVSNPHIFTKSVESVGVKVSANVFDVASLNTNLIVTPPTSVIEAVVFNVNVQWNTGGTTDLSTTQTFMKAVLCVNIDVQKDAPTFAMTTADAALIHTTPGCIEITSLLTTYDVILAQAVLGFTVAVTRCTSDVLDMQFSAQVTVIEMANAGFTEAEATATATVFKNAVTATPVTALVNGLSVIGSFTDNVVIYANGPTQTVTVCTAVQDVVRNSNCSFAEQVTTASFTIAGLEVNAVSGVSMAATSLLQGINTEAAVPMSSPSGMVTDPTILGSQSLEVCNDFVLTATSKAATCGSSNIQLTRDHVVTEKGVNENVQAGVTLSVVEYATALQIIDKSTTAIAIEEDQTILLYQHLSLKRDAAGGMSEKMTKLKMSFTPLNLVDKIFIGGVAVPADGIVEYTTGLYGASGILDDEPALFTAIEWTFKNTFAVSFAADFNTINQPAISVEFEVTATTCDEDTTPVVTTQTRTITIKDTVDTCELTSIVQTSPYNMGTWIDIQQVAYVSNIDEIRHYKMSVAINPGVDIRSKLGCKHLHQERYSI